MPYKSEKQRRYMYAKHPEIAKRWEEKGHNYIEKEYKYRKYRKKKK